MRHLIDITMNYIDAVSRNNEKVTVRSWRTYSGRSRIANAPRDNPHLLIRYAARIQGAASLRDCSTESMIARRRAAEGLYRGAAARYCDIHIASC